MVYDKTKPKAAGKAMFALIEAVREDGPGPEDLDEMSALIIAVASAKDEFADTDAGFAHFVSGLSDAYGDKWVDVA